ncbi:MAG: hypothetical protein JRG97_02965 [Deltaproteobacteria bacterium]|nr:hypothetical protein [Deltaproteobacteria bacterium]MBW2053796.1 hypothetical protein [Deltaproteobacteria bacterium]MBW2140018.1 hypothetical protein [Deltaproteobacteria bacterium]MBW2324538.1 hypothetical protein [Deltaproteobacteria bacterium]
MSLLSDNIDKSGLVKPLVGEVSPNPRSKDRNREGDLNRPKQKAKPRAVKDEDNLPRKKMGKDVDRYV